MRENFLYWGNDADAYFDAADEGTDRAIKLIEDFIGEVPIKDYGTIIDLGCGRGRFAKYLRSKCDNVIAVDVNEENLIRLAGNKYYKDLRQNDGKDIPTFSEVVDFVFCYDAMVHFDLDVVISYLQETYRVLRTGGTAFFHHSNIITSQTDIMKNPHCRNCMNKYLFSYLAKHAGLQVVKQEMITWAGIEDLDCFTLLRKA